MAGLTPPARSWFRLASIARMEAAEAAAAAATARGTTTTPTTPLPPRAPIPRPQQQPTLPPPQPPIPPPQPPTPQPPPQAEPQPKLPVTPPPQPEIQTQAPEAAVPPPSPNGAQRPSTPPPESPKVIMPSYPSPPPSPKAKQTNAAPIQPPPNPEPEPLPPPLPHSFSAAPEEKSIINGNGSRASNASHRKLPAKEEKQLRVITMAGENAGAVMDIGSAASRRLGHHSETEQEHAESKKGGRTAAKAKRVEAVVNSNVQGINNSIVLNSATTQHSPGVHITFASNRKAKGSAKFSSQKGHESDHLH